MHDIIQCTLITILDMLAELICDIVCKIIHCSRVQWEVGSISAYGLQHCAWWVAGWSLLLKLLSSSRCILFCANGLKSEALPVRHEVTLLWRKDDEHSFSPKLRVRIKDNNNSPHGKFHWFLFPFSSKFSDPNFTSYVLYIYLYYVTCHTQWAWVTYVHTWRNMICGSCWTVHV